MAPIKAAIKISIPIITISFIKNNKILIISVILATVFEIFTFRISLKHFFDIISY